MNNENYEQIYEQLIELPKEQQKDFLIRNYQTIIKLTKENDPSFQQLPTIRSFFQKYESTLKNINDEIQELEYARIKSRMIEASDDSDC